MEPVIKSLPISGVDPWLDYDTIFEEATKPYRGGILSPRSRHDPKVTRARLRRDAEAMEWQLHWVVRDLVSARQWGREHSREVDRLRDRLTEVFGLLTPEQRATMRRRDEDRRRG
jgi:hypothetical protein